MTQVHYRTAQQMFTPEVLAASQQHAEAEFPNESVGFVVKGEYIPVKNSHKDPLNHFAVHHNTVKKYAGEIEAVIHSHDVTTDPRTRATRQLMFPSYADQVTQLAWNIPFGIQYVTEDGAGNILWWGNGVPVAEFEGRPYIYAVYDCFTVVKDYYSEQLNITLPERARHDAWWETGESIYENHIKQYGFTEVPVAELQSNDLILLTIRSPVPNHLMLYLGGDRALHHLANSVSKIESASRFIDPDKSLLHSVWRHKDAPK